MLVYGQNVQVGHWVRLNYHGKVRTGLVVQEQTASVLRIETSEGFRSIDVNKLEPLPGEYPEAFIRKW